MSSPGSDDFLDLSSSYEAEISNSASIEYQMSHYSCRSSKAGLDQVRDEGGHHSPLSQLQRSATTCPDQASLQLVKVCHLPSSY